MFNNVKLERPLAIIDLETTGVDTASDRIVEIAILKTTPDGQTTSFIQNFNPGIPIPREATAVHGKTDDDVAALPRFSDYAPEILKFLEDCDLSGFNLVSFDLPLLEAEFTRAGIKFESDNRKLVDTMTIYHSVTTRESGKHRTLKDAYQQYCGQELEDAHGAESDAAASAAVLENIIDAYPELPRDIDGLDVYCQQIYDSYVDEQGKLIFKEGKAIFNFGKYFGVSLNGVVSEDSRYIRYLLGQNFPSDFNEILKRALQGEFPNRS